MLSERQSARLISTDSLARHPGRPWRKEPESIPEHVRTHYSTLTTDELMASVLAHYERLWPMVRDIVTTHLAHSASDQLIIEGSALWPDWVATLADEPVTAVWLTARDDLLRARIYQSSQYHQADASRQKLIQSFLMRTIQYNNRIMQRVRALDLPYTLVDNSDLKDLIEQF